MTRRATLLLVAVIVCLLMPSSASAASGMLPRPGVFVFAGDSLSGDAAWKYPAQLMALLPEGWRAESVAVSGQSSAAMLDGVGDTVALYDPQAASNVASVWVGTNDGPSLGLATYERVVAYCRALRAAGFRVVVLTVLPRTDAYGVMWGQAWRDGRATFNGLLRSRWRTFATYFADVAADERLADAAMYADGVHLTPAGYGVVAEVVADALQRPARQVRRGPHR